MSSQQSLLVMEELTCEREQSPLFAPVSERLESGEVLLLRGANGVGKTTLLRTIAGLRTVSEGSLHIGADASIALRNHQLGLKAELSVLHNLEYAQSLSTKAPTTNIDSALGKVGLAGFQWHAVGALSAGQKKRVALARLLRCQSKIWLLDEPFANLDAAGASLFVSALTAHAQSGGGAIITHHGEPPAGLQITREIVLQATI
jgi:heme exporter protein A